LTREPLEDFAEMFGLECLAIESRTRLDDFKDRLRWNQAAFGRGRG
jgi:L-arabinose isomerase